MADIEKVIKGLESCIGHCAMKDCPYFTESCEAFAGCNGNQIMEDALELLKEQEAVVRCKDCKRYYANGGNCDQVLADWFCADGIAKDTDVLNK